MHSYKIRYETDGKEYTVHNKDCRHFSIDEKKQGDRLIAEIQTKCPLKIKSFRITIPFPYSRDHRIFVNGYQSWTESREYFIRERMNGFSRIKKWAATKPFNAHSGMCRAGDAFFCKYPFAKGKFFGYSYGYARTGSTVNLFASMSEKCGYTIITFDVGKSRVIIEKDFDGVTFSGTRLLADLVHLKGEYDKVFDKWFDMMNIRCRIKEKMCGYTTWYNYYSKITQNIVKRDLEALSALPERMDIFQIDDGYRNEADCR